jgi:hypothetical protein
MLVLVRSGKARNRRPCRPNNRAMPDDPNNHLLRVLEKIQASAAETNVRLESLTVEVRNLKSELKEELQGTNTRLDNLTAFTINGFTALSKYTTDGVARLDHRLAGIDERLGQPDKNAELEARVRAIEDHLGLPHAAG